MKISLRQFNFFERSDALQLAFFGIALGFACLPAVFGFEAVAEISNLYELAHSPLPYFQPKVVGTLYLWTPIVIMSSFIMYLTPGGLLALAFSRLRNIEELVVLAFGWSTCMIVVMSTLLKLTISLPITRGPFLVGWGTATLLAFVAVIWKNSMGKEGIRFISNRINLWRLFGLLIIPVMGIILLIPKIFWENFNVDGIEAFEFGRSLNTNFFPYWDVHQGVFGFYHNFMLFSFPNHWFINWFGPFEAAVRVPFFLYLMIIFCSLVLLIEIGGKRTLSICEKGVLCFGLSIFVVVQTFSTNYDPFFADLAENAATDTLAVLCFLSAIWSLWVGREIWFFVFGLMTHLASPGGVLLLLGLGVAIFLSQSPRWREQVKSVLGVVLGCVVIGIMYEAVYHTQLLGEVKNQFSGMNMLKRLYPPTLTEFVRFNAVLFPCGLLPALALFAVRRRDSLSWSLAGVTVIYFGILYIQAWTSLHQFTLIMLLPLIVFWRLYLAATRFQQKWFFPAIVSTTALSLILSFPQHFQVNVAVREFGLATDYRVGDYENGYKEAVRQSSILSVLIPDGYRLLYPEQPWGFDSLSWLYYSTREKPAGTKINYFVQPTSSTPPQSTTRVLAKDGISVFVKDMDVWQQDRALAFPQEVISPLYEPILRRTYEFFRAYMELKQQDSQAHIQN